MENNNSGIEKPSKDVQDKRYLPRWEVKNRIRYQLDNGSNTREGRSKDISCTGACLLTDQGIAANQKVKLTIDLSEGISVEVEGRILWTRPSAGRNLVGIVFTDIKPEDQELILDYAFEVKKDDVIRHWFKGWNGK